MMRGGNQLVRGFGAVSRQRILSLGLPTLLLIAAFVVVFQVSVAGVFRSAQPRLALTWAPYDAEARAGLAAQLAGIRGSEEARQAAIGLAHDAIRRDALRPAAYRALGLVEAGEAGAGAVAAIKLMEQAERVSRRDQATQIWFIEHYIRQGDPEAVIHHFDIALRTSQSAQQTLFPLLEAALIDPSLFEVLKERLGERPEWAFPFLSYLAQRSDKWGRSVSLTRSFLDPARSEDREILLLLLRRLANQGEYEHAWNLYITLHPARGGSTGGRLVDGGFEESRNEAPFAWDFEDGDLWASPEPSPQADGKVLTVAASFGRSGEVARQLVRLPTGRYRLRAQVGQVPEGRMERPEVRVYCAAKNPGPPLLGVKPPRAGAQTQWISGSFAIPAGCPFQWIAIALAGEGPPQEVNPWIDNIEISPIGR